MKKISISGVGCTLIDFIYNNINFNSPAFQKYTSKEQGDGGLSPGKLVFTEELERFAGKPYPEILKEITGAKTPTTFNLGGPALVPFIHISQMLNEEAFHVRLYAGTGKDEMADTMIKLLKKTPLNISGLKTTSNKATPFTDVFSDPDYDDGHGERTFVNNIGAAWDYGPEDLDESFYDSDIVCFGGTALMPNIHDHLTRLLEKAKEEDCLTVVNTVYDFRNEKKNPGEKWPLGDDEATLELIDLLIMDKEESLKISGKSSLEKASDYFISNGSKAFIITNGGNDLIAWSDGPLFGEKKRIKLPVSARIKEKIQSGSIREGDTTGCGDNFVGGVIVSLADQLRNNHDEALDFTEALAWGVASGGYACFYTGGTFYEESKGEKWDLIRHYYDDYLKQIDKL